MEERKVRITGVKPTSLATFEGLVGLVLGLAVGISAWLGTTIHYTAATSSLLKGLLMGMSAGFLTTIVAGFLYFVAGWILGWVNGVVFNWVLRSMDGLEIATEAGTPEYEQGPSVVSRAEPTFGETIEGRNRRR